MFTLLSGLLGFATSSLPSLLQMWQQKSDQKHELALAQMQNERELAMAQAGFKSQEKIEEIKLEEIQVQSYTQERQALYEHDKALVSNAAPWIQSLNASVRPLIAFIFVGELVIINLVSLVWAICTGVEFPTALDLVFSNDEMAITFTIIGFYYGDSKFGKK
jgi:hypothetical protein